MTPEQILELRALTDGASNYTDAQLQEKFQAAGSLRGAARLIWQETAAGHASLVNISESGSSRSLGDLYKNALAMADIFDDSIAGGKVKRTRKAVRP